MKYWIISSIDCLPQYGQYNDIVKVIHWRRCNEIIYNDIKYYADIFGAQNIELNDIENFIPYYNLTFQDICQWLENYIDLKSIDNELDIQINNKINPPIIQLPLPWNKNIQNDLDNSIDTNS